MLDVLINSSAGVIVVGVAEAVLVTLALIIRGRRRARNKRNEMLIRLQGD
jgi:hypothetical protein